MAESSNIEKERKGMSTYQRTTGVASAYLASVLAFAYGLVSLYWTLGGTYLLNTVGGSIAGNGGMLAIALGASASVAKIIIGLLALALVRPLGNLFPRRFLVASAVTVSAVLIIYGGLLVIVGALVLLYIIHPTGNVDWIALRWHVLVWDM
ncbi:MAG: DUF3995 domain-containing protein [Candidatus Thermoplasmatota archaeon]|jgi:hypothetical protein|nr:DUF3995 domain-containing protein [Candidatus Thermoplasmatota archaeon]